MKLNSPYFLGFILGIAIVLGALWQLFPLTDADIRIRQLPLLGPNISGQDIPLSSEEEELFKRVNIVKRVYKVGKDSYFIYILDGTNNRHAVHDPTYCFTGSGFQVVSDSPITLSKGSGSLYVLKKGTAEKQALIWFSDGKEQFASPLLYWWKATLRRLTMGYSGEEPVLIVVQPLNTESHFDWQKLLNDFPELKEI